MTRQIAIASLAIAGLVALADQIGMGADADSIVGVETELYAGQSPEQKVEIVRRA